MLTGLLFGLAVTLVAFTAGPVVACRQWLINLLYTHCNQPRFKVSETVSTLLNCPTCSMFYVAIPLWYLLPYIPQAIVYAIYLAALLTIFDYLKYRFQL